jgi:hypothetical protein
MFEGYCCPPGSGSGSTALQSTDAAQDDSTAPVSVVDEHVLQVLSGEGGLLWRRLEQPGLFGGGARLALVRTRHH